MIIKLHNSRQAQSSTYVTQIVTPTYHRPKTEMNHSKNLKPKPKQHSTCLEIVCKVSHPLDKGQAFHNPMKFKTIQKLI